MPREFQFQVSPEVAANESLLAQHVAKLFQVSSKEIQKVVVLKRSIDARQKAIKMNIKANVFLVGEDFSEQKIELPDYPNVAIKQEVIVIGAGPAGLFAALQLIELGLKPIVHAGSVGGSDHVSFYKKNISVLGMHTGGHPQYHTPEDTTDSINISGEKQVCEYIYKTLMELATTNYKMEYIQQD
jgi:uncharacterized FAD-dependent dehydrogenase